VDELEVPLAVRKLRRDLGRVEPLGEIVEVGAEPLKAPEDRLLADQVARENANDRLVLDPRPGRSCTPRATFRMPTASRARRRGGS
jgi:hypothetical protein